MKTLYHTYLTHFAFVRSGATFANLNPKTIEEALAIALAVSDGKSEEALRSYESFKEKCAALSQGIEDKR
jgi:hypothetical protein